MPPVAHLAAKEILKTLGIQRQRTISSWQIETKIALMNSLPIPKTPPAGVRNEMGFVVKHLRVVDVNGYGKGV